ncbi:MAG: DUF2127 domain-containing protein [bacterium]
MIDWSALSCSLRGHITYRPDEPALAERLSAPTVAGEAWRCLRCGAYVAGEPRGQGPADEAPTPVRGRALRELIILRLLALLRALEGTAWLLAGTILILWRSRVPGVIEAFREAIPDLAPAMANVGWDIERSWLARLADRLAEVTPDSVFFVCVFLLAMGTVKWAEAVGLWMAKRWGEYLAVIATSAFIPLEVYELIEHVSAFKLVLLLINVAAVAWLIWAKRLFGVRGGTAALQAENEEASLVAVERAAMTEDSAASPTRG